jgi:hypothetical protein
MISKASSTTSSASLSAASLAQHTIRIPGGPQPLRRPPWCKRRRKPVPSSPSALTKSQEVTAVAGRPGGCSTPAQNPSSRSDKRPPSLPPTNLVTATKALPPIPPMAPKRPSSPNHRLLQSRESSRSISGVILSMRLRSECSGAGTLACEG